MNHQTAWDRILASRLSFAIHRRTELFDAGLQKQKLRTALLLD